ncbi:MFS transporter [Bradyrhizobium liaoningense]|uniref:MFS transporter n=1 Tax=Bradyrhizobium liaoningense TaxID=43992 RepID=UPI001BA68BB1|nr:MFS transporter [Bradyrhizobium liaoningense]MBR0713194.1 MFS transporter [Bradyrhizobium liaoningense]
MSGFARPFRIRNYRFQWPADLLTSWAFEMETLVLGWYVMVETGSVLLLTVLASLNYVGTLIAPMFGVIGDRIGHRDLLAMMRATYAVLSATLMTLALTGHLTPSYVMIIVSVMGLIRPSDLGVRAALVADVMPSELLIGAISISRTTQDTARIAGALSGAGLFAALGIGPVYVAIMSLYLVGTFLTLCIKLPKKARAAVVGEAFALRSPFGDLKEGLAHVWTTPQVRAAMWVAFLVNLTAFPLTSGLLPYVAREIYATDQTGLGYLSASFATGSLAGSMALSFVTGLRVARLMIGATAVWYATLLVFVQLKSVPIAMACLFLAGFSQSLSMISVAVILMRSVAERLRGRVMGVRMMVIYGLPLGLLAAGSLIDLFGFAMTGTLYALSGMALMLAIALHWRADLWPVHAAANAR